MAVRSSTPLARTVISCSRRTDVPTFYVPWLMQRVREGRAVYHNPFSGRPCEVSLDPENVAALVFWSKNYRPLLPCLPELEARGYAMLFHYTITGLGPVFESHVPAAAGMLDVLRRLSARYGPRAVIWRYDPVVLSPQTPPDWHRRHFEAMCRSLEGIVEQCMFSFTCYYGKVRRATRALQQRTGLVVADPPAAQRLALAGDLADIAAASRIALRSCCCDDVVAGKVEKARCIDADLLASLYPDRFRKGPVARKPTRANCGCSDSRDIGAYDTCPHGCFYCYANLNRSLALERYRAQDAHTPSLGKKE